MRHCIAGFHNSYMAGNTYMTHKYNHSSHAANLEHDLTMHTIFALKFLIHIVQSDNRMYPQFFFIIPWPIVEHTLCYISVYSSSLTPFPSSDSLTSEIRSLSMVELLFCYREIWEQIKHGKYIITSEVILPSYVKKPFNCHKVPIYDWSFIKDSEGVRNCLFLIISPYFKWFPTQQCVMN